MIKAKYIAQVHCYNCNKHYDQMFKRSEEINTGTCTYCGCKTLIPETNYDQEYDT